MYRCYVQMWIVVKIKVIVHKKCLVFCNSDLIHSLVWVKVSQILVNFKGNESTWNLRYFSFFKKECLKSLQNLHSRSKSELEKNIHKNKLKFRPFSNFSFLVPATPHKKTLENEMKLSQISSFNAKLQNFLSTNMSKIFSWKEKFSVCFFSFQRPDRKVHFAAMTVAKTGLGLEILGNFKAMLSNIAK